MAKNIDSNNAKAIIFDENKKIKKIEITTLMNSKICFLFLINEKTEMVKLTNKKELK